MSNNISKPEENQELLGKLPEHEIGGRKEGLDPTRYSDWELKGRAIDF